MAHDIGASLGFQHGRHWQQVLTLRGTMGWSFEALSWLLVLLNAAGVLVVALASRTVLGVRFNLLQALLWGALSLDTSVMRDLWNPNFTALPLACFWGASLGAFKRPRLYWFALAGAALGVASGFHAVHFLGLGVVVFVAFSTSRHPLTSSAAALISFGGVWEILSPGTLEMSLSAPVVQGGGFLAFGLASAALGLAFRWLRRFLDVGQSALLFLAASALFFSVGLYAALTRLNIHPNVRYFGMYVTPLALSLPVLAGRVRLFQISDRRRQWFGQLFSAAVTIKAISLVPVLKGPPWDHSLLSLDDALEISSALYEEGFSYDALSLHTVLCDSGATAEIFGMFEPVGHRPGHELPPNTRLVVLKLAQARLPPETPDNWQIIHLKRGYVAVVATFPSFVDTDRAELCSQVSSADAAETCHQISYNIEYPMGSRVLFNDPGRRLWQFMEQETAVETTGQSPNDLQFVYRFNLWETMPAGNYTLLSGLTMGQVRLRDDSDATTIRLDVDHFNAEWPLVFALIPADDPLLQYRDILRPCTPQPFLLSRPDPP